MNFLWYILRYIYHFNKSLGISSTQFIEILYNSTLGERRPVDDIKTIQEMLDNTDIIITATINDKIIRIARTVTDFNYCCYLSDLAVHKDYQHKGIGKKLINKVQEQLNNKCKIILLSAPNASEYYPNIGFTQHDSAWVLAQ